MIARDASFLRSPPAALLREAFGGEPGPEHEGEA